MGLTFIHFGHKKTDMFDGSGFCLTELMSRNCLEAILSARSYVDHNPPVLLDHFWEVRQLIDGGIAMCLCYILSVL